MTEAEKMNAYIWAAKVETGAVPLFAISKGDKFRWASIIAPSMTIFEYRGGGWCKRVDGRGKCFRSGVKTAVIQVKE